MRFRIGVNLGDVIAQDDGTIYGDGVNVAARLESLTEPGGVTVSESDHMHVEGKIARAMRASQQALDYTPTHAGQTAEADRAVARLRALHPDFDMDALRCWPFRHAATWDRFTDGLRKAGLDIPDEPTATD